MKQHEQDQLFREMARLYLDRQGEELKGELAEMERQKVAFVTPRLDRKVRAATGGGARKRRARIISLLAACAVLALLVPSLLRTTGPDLTQPSGDSAAAPTESSVDAPTESGVAAPAEEPAMSEGEAHEDTARYKLLPLSAPLPANLSVAGYEQDNEKSIYYLSDQLLDDVVVTLEWDTWQPGDYRDLAPIPLGGETAWGASRDGYQLLTFEKEEIRYVMTCRYDINTLVQLGEYMI